MFPGQPLNREPVVPDDQEFAEIAELCRQRCGYDIISHKPMPGHQLSHHTCLQTYGVAVSLYKARKLKIEGVAPDIIAEHSLGIYAALAASGSISEGDALELACRIGSCMCFMGKDQQYALGCAIGISRQILEQAADDSGVFVANYNTSKHFLLAGSESGVEAALAQCVAAGAFSVSQLPCEAPLHTPLMSGIVDKLAAIVAEYRFDEPNVPLIEHITQTRLTASAIPDFMVDELHKPVYWEKTWQILRKAGLKRTLEVGSGNTLTKFNRWIDSEKP